MSPRHVSILKPKQGEFKALLNTRDDVARKILPLFEIGRLTETLLTRKYLADSAKPTMMYLDRVASDISKAWGGRLAMVDGYFWSPEASTEDGDHVISYMIRRLEKLGTPVIPVIGYDRFENVTYQASMRGLSFNDEREFCLRLDSEAIGDAIEPEFFRDSIGQILDGLDLPPERVSILLDFGDVTTTSISDLIAGAARVVTLLKPQGFNRYVVAGCSIPKSIDLAVEDPDTSNMIVRREMLLWKMLRQEFKNTDIVYGDYGVRGPSTNDEIRSRYTNGKIRHTIGQQTFVVRGHPIVNDGNAKQMHELAKKITQSPYYLGADFSWGDERIEACSFKTFLGSLADWVAVDTNHHLAYVVQEVEEFERSVVMAKDLEA